MEKLKEKITIIIIQSFFKGTYSRIGGVDFNILAREGFSRHRITYWDDSFDTVVIHNPGTYHWRAGGEKHINDPRSIASLQVT